MPLRRRRSHYQQLTEFERGRVAGLREGGFSFRDTAERIGRNVCTVHDCWHQWSKEEIRTAVGTTVTQRTVSNRLLQGQLRARRPVACILLTPNHCRLRLERCQARAHWRTEWRCVVFPDESRFCLGASDGRVLVRRRPGERLQPTCLRPTHTGPTPGVMVWGAMTAGALSWLSHTP
ncbi:hypothetical protein AVEN_83751-1 [Araneus ventricosus]|uniref:Transposase IS30-like HTH domain-containing protein n=1 Tax=Araneus ventricosus TaxID=182803 RepID=A0A4Y2WB83_ARAVE|nr:hypothetical protein AVEN_83751-1 [Araneus ventricosus]